MPLPKFKDEADFRTKWIAPFLSKLGYILVNHIHGSGEQGKDFFFADFDRFEHRRFYAVQAKLGKIGAGQVELDNLLNQVRRSFTVRLRFHKEADEKNVSAVYIMASGSISKEAREYISDWCKRQAFGENVYYLDGSTLERLNTYAFQRIDHELRAHLLGLWRECQYNEKVLDAIHQAFQEKKTRFDRCRHAALERLLVSPPAEDFLASDLLERALTHLAVVNKLCDYHLLPMTTTDEQWLERVEKVKTTWAITVSLRDAAIEAIRMLDERYAISVEVVE